MNTDGASAEMPGSEQRTLASHEVDVWLAYQARADSAELLETYRGLLTPDELAMERRFLLPRLRLQFLVTRALVRWSLSQYHPVAPDEWRFVAGRFGKPVVSAPLPASRAFNLSHSAGLVVCAIAGQGEIGADVEDIRRPAPWRRLATRFFSQAETDGLERLPERQRTERFMQIWTLKESYIKAIGKGLSAPLDRFAIEIPPDGPTRVSFADPQDTSQWRFAQATLNDQYHVAVAAADAPDDWTVRLSEVVPLRPETIRRVATCSRDNHWRAAAP